MAEQRLGIIMHGVTGRMGTNQHLVNSIKAIRAQGGVALADGTRIMPDPILVGRNADKLRRLAEAHGVERWTTDLDAALANADDTVFFDSASTNLRADNVMQAIRAGKHIYCEKPPAHSAEAALEMYRLAEEKGVCHGVVQDKLYLPGLMKLQRLNKAGFFGRVLSMRIEFGYWVFEGDLQQAQRPSWNYRSEDAGGIITDMVCHWQYVLENLVAPVTSVSCIGATHIPQRWDENGDAYKATADDAAYATFELEGGVIAQVNSSWCVRVRRDDLVTFQIDGTEGSAVAGLWDCRTQPRVNTPKPVWNPDAKQPVDLFADWLTMPDNEAYDSGFKTQWEMFIRHVYGEGDWPHTLLAGARGIQLAELAHQSWAERRWVDVPELAGNA